MTTTSLPRRLRLPELPKPWIVRVGLALTAIILVVALVGPYFAPHGPTELLAPPYERPTAAFPFGSDGLGRDVLSRVLWGGRRLIFIAAIATLIGYAVGLSIGLVSAYAHKSAVDPLLMRAMDVLLAFPPLLLLLLLATGVGAGVKTIIIGTAILHVPSCARVMRAAALEVIVRGYVEAATARGDRWWQILRREVLPNLRGPIVADAGPRFTASIFMVAALNFLGLGIPAPDADWASMINENRSGLELQPFALIVPAALIALLTLGLNSTADHYAREHGRELEGPPVA